MSTLSISNVIDELVSDLTAVAGLSEWKITFGPAGEPLEKVIEIGHGDIAWTEELLDIGEDDKMEEYSIPCWLMFAEPGSADENATKKAALDAALEGLAYVETFINANDSGTYYDDAQIVSGNVGVTPFEGTFRGWAAYVEFNITVKEQKAP